MNGLGLTDYVPFSINFFLARLQTRSTLRGIGRGKRGRRWSKGVSGGSGDE